MYSKILNISNFKALKLTPSVENEKLVAAQAFYKSLNIDLGVNQTDYDSDCEEFYPESDIVGIISLNPYRWRPMRSQCDLLNEVI